MSKVLVLGGGYIGEKIADSLGATLTSARINCLADALAQIKKHSPDIVINAIGHIGRNVDDCELDKDKSLLANAYVPFMVAEAAIRLSKRLVHISSGCIYLQHGFSPISETLMPDSFDLFYSRLKIYSEQGLLPLCKRYPFLIARIRIPLDDKPHPKNIINKLLSYKNIIDIPNSVTYLPDFMSALSHLIRIRATGIYNIVNKGALRYPYILEEYRKYHPDYKYTVVDHRKLGISRTNLVLSTRKLEASGFNIRPIKEVIKECVSNYAKYEQEAVK